MTRKIVVVAGLIALTALAVWFFRTVSASAGASNAPLTSGHEDHPASSSRRVELDAGAAREEPEPNVHGDERVAAISERPSSADELVPKPRDAETDQIQLSGTVVVLDELGVEHREESGQFSFVVWRGHIGVGLRVDVHDGKWITTVPRNAELGCGNGNLGGRETFAEEPDLPIPIPETHVLVRRMRWSRASVLRVKAEDTGLELDKIELVRSDDLSSGRVHPGNSDEKDSVLESARSPIELPQSGMTWNGGVRTYCARSPGYAWGRIDIDAKAGGERILVLKPGGGLDIVLTGHDANDAAVLRVRMTGKDYESPVFEQEIGADTQIAIDSLPVGHYSVEAELGHWWASPLVLAKGPHKNNFAEHRHADAGRSV